MTTRHPPRSRARTWLRRLAISVGVVLVLAVSCVLAITPSIPPRPELSGEIVAHLLEHDGLERRYEVYAPADLPPGRPLVFHIHGSGVGGDDARDYMGWQLERLADAERFVIAYPEGWQLEWNGCRSPGVSEADRRDLDDVGFHLAIIEQLVERHAIDRRRVYALGFSNGGQMVYRLASDAPGHFAAVASVIANVPVPDNSDCNAPAGPIPMLIMNGDADPIIPWEGGEASLFGFSARGQIRSALDSAAHWRAVNGIADDAPSVERRPDRDPDDGSWVERHEWGADTAAPVVLYRVHGGGHNFPGGIELGSPWLTGALAGRANGDVDGAQEVWRFFSRFRRE